MRLRPPGPQEEPFRLMNSCPPFSCSKLNPTRAECSCQRQSSNGEHISFCLQEIGSCLVSKVETRSGTENGKDAHMIVSHFQIKNDASTTQEFVLARWEIDWVEVIDGVATCCDGGVPLLTSVRRTANATVLQWTSVSDRTYQLQFRPSLRAGDPWTDVGGALSAQGPSMIHTNINSPSNGFYRVRRNP